MMDDSKAILDDLLSRFHHWCKNYSPVPVCGADPMFRNAKSGKGWDSTNDVIEDELNGATMRAVEFHIGEIQEPHRAALYILARNCYTGREVWMSPRLPSDKEHRIRIVAEARFMLTNRLHSAGVL